MAIGVTTVFTVLAFIWFILKVLQLLAADRVQPHVLPPHTEEPRPPVQLEDHDRDELTAIITASLTHILGRTPRSINIRAVERPWSETVAAITAAVHEALGHAPHYIEIERPEGRIR